jgi:hypothetical protein
VETDKQKSVNVIPDKTLALQGEAEPQRKIEEGLFPNVGRSRSWWWVELWTDKRELVKGTVAHTLFFGALVGSLEGAHRLLKWSTLPPDELYVLNKVHFYMYAIILTIFAFSFIVKVLKLELSGKRQ